MHCGLAARRLLISLLPPPCQPSQQQVLKYHVVPGTPILSSDMSDEEQLVTVLTAELQASAAVPACYCCCGSGRGPSCHGHVPAMPLPLSSCFTSAPYSPAPPPPPPR